MKRMGLILLAVGVVALLVTPAVRADTFHWLDFADVNGGGVGVFAANISASSQLLIGSSGSVATISGIGSRPLTLSAGITEFSVAQGGSLVDTSVSVGSLSGYSVVDIFTGSTLVARALVTSAPDSVSVVPNPEPASLLLLSGSLAVGIGFLRRQRVKKS